MQLLPCIFIFYANIVICYWTIIYNVIGIVLSTWSKVMGWLIWNHLCQQSPCTSLEVIGESVTNQLNKCLLKCVVVCACVSVRTTIFRLVTPDIKLDSSAVWLDPTQRRLDSPGEWVDSSTTVVTASQCPRLRPVTSTYSNGQAGRDGLRRPAAQPAAAGQALRWRAESDSGVGRRRQRLARDEALEPALHLHLTVLLLLPCLQTP